MDKRQQEITKKALLTYGSSSVLPKALTRDNKKCPYIVIDGRIGQYLHLLLVSNSVNHIENEVILFFVCFRDGSSFNSIKLENPSKRPQSDTSPIPGEGCYLPDVFPRPKAWLSKADAVFGAKGPTLTKVMAKSKENDTRVYGQAYVEENIGLYK